VAPVAGVATRDGLSVDDGVNYAVRRVSSRHGEHMRVESKGFRTGSWLCKERRGTDRASQDGSGGAVGLG
jgi:hypothetical protein